MKNIFTPISFNRLGNIPDCGCCKWLGMAHQIPCMKCDALKYGTNYKNDVYYFEKR